MDKCKDPTCSFSVAKDKCVTPSPYNEMMAWCKRNGISNQQCKLDYSKDPESARRASCDRHREKNAIDAKKKPKKGPKEPKPVSPKPASPKKASPKSASKDLCDFDSPSPPKNVLPESPALHSNLLKNVNPTNIMKKRIENYKRITDHLKITKINNKGCLSIKDNELHIMNNGFDILLSEKPLAKPGTFGVAYSVSSEYTTDARIDKFKYALKIQLNKAEAKKEINILASLTKKAINDGNIHLPIMYANFLCENISNVQSDMMPVMLQQLYTSKTIKKYNLSLVELGNGDFKSFLGNLNKIESKTERSKVFSNAVAQIFMCMLTLHKYGVFQNDTHWGNFLYFQTKPGGYFHYIIDGKSFYLENLGYVWISWDFGVSGSLKLNTDHIRDYAMFALFIRTYTPMHLNMRFDTSVRDENGKIMELYTGFRRFGNLDPDIHIPDNIKSVAEYIDTLYGGKIESADFKILKSSLPELKKKCPNRYRLSTTLEKDLILNIIKLLGVFDERCGGKEVIATMAFDHLDVHTKNNMCYPTKDRIVVPSYDYGTQHFIKI